MALTAVADAEHRQRTAAAAGTTASSSSHGQQQQLQPQQQQQQYHSHQPHGPNVDCHHNSVLATICSDEAAMAKTASLATAIPAHASSSSSSDSSLDAAIEQKHPQQQQPQQQQQSSGTPSAIPVISSGGRMQANLMAASAAAVVGAFLEAPMELFKHQTQAGQLQGNMLKNMVQAFKVRGLPCTLLHHSFMLCSHTRLLLTLLG